MPSGKTHDRITGYCVPGVTILAQLITEHWGYTSLVVAGFLFGGLMFGPDLDVQSIQSKRWGWLGWIWYPYRTSISHRSWLSHGFLTGTLVRLFYLSVWSLLALLLVLEFSNGSGHTRVTWEDLWCAVGQSLRQYWRIWLAIAIGIELGAMSHSISDWAVSSWKRQRRPKRKAKHRRR